MLLFATLCPEVWAQFTGAAISNDGKTLAFTGERQGKDVLYLLDVTSANVNRYRCLVSNAFGTATSREAVLRVDAGTKTWIGPLIGGAWNTATNWNPIGVPSIADEFAGTVGVVVVR